MLGVAMCPPVLGLFEGKSQRGNLYCEHSLNMFQLLHPNFETLSSLMKKRCSKEQYMGPQMASY